MDSSEKVKGPNNVLLEGVIRYMGSIGTALWNEIKEDRSKVRLDLGGLLCSLTGSFQGYDLESHINNLFMDVSGVELSVANAHHQIQHVKDKVIKELSNKVTAHYHNFFTSGGAMESKFNGRMEEHFGDLLHFVNNKEDNTEAFNDVVNTQALAIVDLTEWVDAQAVTITALKDWVGELELGHCLLCDRIIAIKVRMSMVASDLWN